VNGIDIEAGGLEIGTWVPLVLVEDDDGDALIVSEQLAMVGVDEVPDRATTLAEALVLCDGFTGCILLDLALPDASGLDAVRALRDVAPEAAIVVLTGLKDDDHGASAVAAGAQDYLTKGSADGRLLMRAARYAVERRRAEAAALRLREATIREEENRRLERGLLPVPLVADPHVRIASAYRPGRRRALLGGDFYDAVQGDDGTVRLLIGDVCGHSADEAALGAALRIAWRALALAGVPDDELLGHVAAMVECERGEDLQFATAAMVTVAPDRRTLAVRLAGHPPPLLWRDGAWRPLDGRPGTPLGTAHDRRWPATVHEAGAGWALMLYTDGLVEGYAGLRPGRLGEDGLLRLLRSRTQVPSWTADPDDLLSALVLDVEATNDGPLVDDVAVLLMLTS
jgi:serine phosphatase RsbU (regulator of sigma subunit)